jgi:hypothetical protein
VFVDGGEVSLLFVEELELEEGAEIVWVSEEQLEQTSGRAHYFFF